MKKCKTVFVLVSVLLLLCSCTGGTKEEKYDIAGKTYYNTVDVFGNEDHSKIWFGKDGTFVFKDNYSDGFYELSGTWKISENVVTLDSKDSGSMDVKEIHFEIQDDETLLLKASLPGSKLDDVFSTTEVKGSSAQKPDDNPGMAGQITYLTYYDCSLDPGFEAQIDLNSDGTFTFIEKSKYQTVEVKGTYTKTDHKVTCGGFEPFNGYEAEMVSEITFDIYDDQTLILTTRTGFCDYGDVFNVNKVIPASYEEGPKGDSLGNYHSYWVHAPIKDVNDAYLPSIKFESSGMFTFTENCYSGMGQYIGWYEKTEAGFICHVDDASSMKGYAGGDVETINLQYSGDNEVILLVDLCMSMAGDRFVLTQE